MAALRPPVPQTLDVVPASEVGELLTRTDQEFVALEARVEGLRADAADAEAAAVAEGVDPSSSTWTMVRLQRFLDGLRDEARRDADAVVEVARQRARVRVADARGGVGGVGGVGGAAVGADAPWSPGAASTVTPFTPLTPFTPQVVDPPSEPSPFAPPTFEGGAPVAPAAGMVTAVAVAPTIAPAVNGSRSHVADDIWSAAPIATEPFVAAAAAAPPAAPVLATAAVVAPVLAPVLMPEPAVAEPLPATTPAAEVDAKLAPAEETAVDKKAVDKKAVDKKAEKQARKAAEAEARAKMTAGATPKPGLLKRLPITAILEVLAVLLILIFILLRLS